MRPNPSFLVSAIVLLVTSIASAGAAGTQALGIERKSDSIELRHGDQRIVFNRGDAGYVLSTFVRNNDRWEPLFDARRPIISGAEFNLAASDCEIVADEPNRKVLRLRGTRSDPTYDWDLLVEARAQRPMTKFTFTAHLKSALQLSAPEPTIAFWMNRPSAELTIDQGPSSIYGSAGIPHNLGFPAAYLWDAGKEAVVFFNFTPMTWFSQRGVQRFYDLQIMNRAQDGATGIGMHTLKLSGKQIPAGDMVIEWHLYSASRPTKPTKLQALDTMIRVCAPEHPATSVFPRDRVADRDVSWTDFARNAIDDLMKPKVGTWTAPANWTDEPMRLVDPVTEVVGHGGTADGTSGDFSCNNNHLSPSILFARVTDDAGKLDFARRLVRCLPLYYDPKAQMIRWGTREPPQVGEFEMSWQNFFFNVETLRSSDAMPLADFNPAINGRFIMGADSLVRFAHNVDYVFPQWLNPYKKVPVIQQDVPKLGKVREPWQAGTYAYLMLKAHELTGKPEYLQEAKESIDTLLTKMRYTESNDVYTRSYIDPVDFPITELFGQTYGIVAANRIYEQTRDERYLNYSRAFLDTLLRLTFWSEDETDPISRQLRNAGLFYPHCGAHLCCPWETNEAYIGITYAIEHDRTNPILPLLLKLSNLNRINSFYFYPATFTPDVAALDPKRRQDVGLYWPIEPFYGFEAQGGQRGNTAAYMSCNALWNYWMYEALATADDRDVLVLNTDILDNYEEAVRGAERHLVVFNPTDSPRKFSVRLNAVRSGKYEVDFDDGAGKSPEKRSADDAELRKGLALQLQPMQYERLTIRHEQVEQMKQQVAAARGAQRALSFAYARLQQVGTAAGEKSASDERLSKLRQAFIDAQKQYRDANYRAAEKMGREVVLALDGKKGESSMGSQAATEDQEATLSSDRRTPESAPARPLSLDEIDRTSFKAGPAPMDSPTTVVALSTGAAEHPAGAVVLSLDGEWDLAEGGEDQDRLTNDWRDCIYAPVPGSIHTALERGGIIPDHTVGMQDAAARLKSFKTWWMKKTFHRPEKSSGGERLIFGGVAVKCTVWLNGTKLGSHEGMFGGPEFDIASLLKDENTLIVKIDPAPFEIGHGFPNDFFRGMNVGWMRTVVFNNVYGWHYSNIPSLGIWRPVKVEAAPTVRIKNPFVATHDATAGVIDLIAELEGSAGAGFKGMLVGTILPETFEGSPQQFSQSITSASKGKTLHLRITVPDAKLWWPNDLGKPNLYRLKLSFVPEGEGVADLKQTTFGIRSIAMAPLPGGPNPERYNWTFIINGRPIFVKGNGWCTMDSFMDFSPQRYDRFLSIAHAQHVQMIRCWGSGMPETDEFYDLCDRKGIMVLQEWPTAWNSHEWQPLEMLEETVRLNTLRLRNHPSLAMWGGGNESDKPFGAAIDMMGRYSIELDGTRPFHRGEPWGGSKHDYNCWWGRQPLDFNLTMTSNFFGEFGLASSPVFESVQRYLPAADQHAWPPPPHGAFAYHTPVFNTKEDVSRLLQYAGYFTNNATIEDVVIGSQLAQAVGVRHALERARTRWPDCTGALYYKMNDNWPAVSWSCADWYGAPKIGHFFFQDAFAPVHACTLFDSVNIVGKPVTLPVYLLDDNNELDTASWEVVVRAFDAQLKQIKTQRYAGTSSIDRVKQVGEFSLDARQTDAVPLLVVTEVRRNDNVVDRTFYFVNYEARKGSLFSLPRTELAMKREGDRVSVTNTGTFPAVAVHIERPGHADTFLAGDGYFWLDSGETKSIEVNSTVGLTVAGWNAATSTVGGQVASDDH